MWITSSGFSALCALLLTPPCSPSPPSRPTPSSRSGPRHAACRPSTGSGPSTTSRHSGKGWRKAPRGRVDRQERGAADVLEHRRGPRERRHPALDGQRSLLHDDGSGDERRAAGHQPGGGSPSLGPARRHPARRGPLPARQGGLGSSREPFAHAGTEKAARRQLQGLRRGGANLGPDEKKRFRAINQELSVLGLRFADNLLKETNGFRLVVERREDLAGLPAGVVASAADAAKAAGLPASGSSPSTPPPSGPS